MRPCTHPRCPNIVVRGACPIHKAKARQVEARYTKGNYGRPWRRLRQQFLEDAYPWFCSLHAPPCTARNRQMSLDEVEVDHLVPHRGDVTLRDDRTNLQVLCRACHSYKTAQEVGWSTPSAQQRAGR
jgi:5-methylcytosine-specific restriction protein A